jgi:hypothetical protein
VRHGPLSPKRLLLPRSPSTHFIIAYGLLLLALSLQSSDPVVMGEAAVRRELQGIWASCWILYVCSVVVGWIPAASIADGIVCKCSSLRGLRGYGVVWDGLDAFAGTSGRRTTSQLCVDADHPSCTHASVADELQAALNASLALSGEPARIWE